MRVCAKSEDSIGTPEDLTAGKPLHRLFHLGAHARQDPRRHSAIMQYTIVQIIQHRRQSDALHPSMAFFHWPNPARVAARFQKLLVNLSKFMIYLYFQCIPEPINGLLLKNIIWG